MVAADALGVRVHDHLIIGRHGAASMKSLGLM
ncbi:MAG: JAB domain-containing protein [Alphaproteobacteria bacterium]|nr:JAB domain-containing protein [Alphaproteobacteria bacterium]